MSAPPPDSRAIVVLSIGTRPWFDTLEPWFEAYAERVGAKLLLAQHDAIPPSDLERLSPFVGQTLKLKCHFLKLLYVRDALERFEEVVLLDDSCFVSPSCPDLFSAAPAAPLAAVHLEDHGVFNVGVLRTSQELREFLADMELEYVRQGKPRTETDLLNRAIREERIRCEELDPRFNRCGSQILREGLDAIDAWIYHLTSYLHETDRRRFAESLSQRFAAEVAKSNKAPWTVPRVRGFATKKGTGPLLSKLAQAVGFGGR